MSDYVIAIDQGTTSTRAIVFDKKGSIISTGQLEHKQIFPKPGWVEHDVGDHARPQEQKHCCTTDLGQQIDT